MNPNFTRRRSSERLLSSTSLATYRSFDKLQQSQETKSHQHKPNPWLRKPLWAVSEEGPEDDEQNFTESKRSLHRHLTLFDLISIGVGATIGSGVFVLCGLIAHDYAGPATFISWGIAGLSACASGLCYAELSGKFSVPGSSYSYVYISMGELPAVIASACLTLEYIFSASAVARSWGDKVVAYVQHIHVTIGDGGDSWMMKFLDPGYCVNPAAFVVSAASVLLLLDGVKESQKITNFFTMFKVILVLFMCMMALFLFQPENFEPMIPVKFGFTGVMRGSVSTFFGYIGYDEICCMAGEAINPKRNLPRAVMGTILIVTVLYVLAAVALVGMVPYNDISVTSGFPDGFHFRGIEWASQISAIGELITLPIVVLVTIMAQPRLQFAMAADGLLPPIFMKMDETGNLWWGTLISGVLCVAIATCVPFTYLNDLISAGILLAFSLTDASVIILRQTSPANKPFLLQKLLFAFNFLSFTMGLLLGGKGTVGHVLSGCNFLALLVITFFIGNRCPKAENSDYGDYFETPFIPYLPLIAQFLNWYLIGQLEARGLLLLLAYIGLAVIFYFLYGAKHSFGNTIGWNQIEEVVGTCLNRDVDKEVRTMISMPLVQYDNSDVGEDDGISMETEGQQEEDDISIGTKDSSTNGK